MTESLPLPLPQSPEYARACRALGLHLRSGGQRDTDESLVWQGVSRRLRHLGEVALISRGPVAARAQDLADWPAHWRRHAPGCPVLLNADGLAPDMLRAAGFWPLLTPATLALLPLGTAPEMRTRLAQKWRNRLNAAERAGLEVIRRDPAQDDWLLAAEARMARARGYRGLPPAFLRAFARATPGAAQVFEARRNGQPLAAALVLRHGRMATWQTAQSLPDGRRLNAMNLVLWTAMSTLAALGHETLDLGPVDSVNAPGLARFKLGTGAHPHRLGGTWLYLRALAPVARRLPLRAGA